MAKDHVIVMDLFCRPAQAHKRAVENFLEFSMRLLLHNLVLGIHASRARTTSWAPRAPQVQAGPLTSLHPFGAFQSFQRLWGTLSLCILIDW